MATITCWISWLIREDSCDCNSGRNKTLKVMAKGEILSRARDVKIISPIKFSIVDRHDVAVGVDEVGIGGGVLVTTEELALALYKA